MLPLTFIGAGLGIGKALWSYFAGSKADQERSQNQKQDLKQRELDWQYQKASSSIRNEANLASYNHQIKNLKLAQIRDIEKTAYAQSLFKAIAYEEMNMMKNAMQGAQQELASNIIDSGVMMSSDSMNLLKGKALMSEQHLRLIQLKNLSKMPQRALDGDQIATNISALENQINFTKDQSKLDSEFNIENGGYFGNLNTRLDKAAKGSQIKRAVGLGLGATSTAFNYFLD